MLKQNKYSVERKHIFALLANMNSYYFVFASDWIKQGTSSSINLRLQKLSVMEVFFLNEVYKNMFFLLFYRLWENYTSYNVPLIMLTNYSNNTKNGEQLENTNKSWQAIGDEIHLQINVHTKYQLLEQGWTQIGIIWILQNWDNPSLHITSLQII